MTVGAVIVPAGADEALTDSAGRAAVRRIVDAAWAGGAMPIVVVAHDPDAAVADVLSGSPAVLIERPAGSEDDAFAAGSTAASKAVRETSAVLLWPGRMTWVDPETVTSLIEAHGRSSDRRARPGYEGEPGWPVLVPVAAGDPGLDTRTHEDASVLELGDPGSVLDLTTPLDGLPAYAGPPEPVGGPPPEWGAAAAETPEPEVGD